MRIGLFLLILISPVLAQPTIDHISPAAISSKGGQITLHGSGLKEPLSLWSIPVAEATFSDIFPDSVTCQIKFAQPTQDQFLTLRLATRSGISNPILIAIDDLPTVRADGQNKSFKQPQPIQIPAAIEGS